MNEMRNRVRRITRDLNALLKEIATVREQHACELVEEVLTEETVAQFKSAVDAMRRLLWVYIEAAARSGSKPRHSRQTQILKRAAEALRTLHQGEARFPPDTAAGSFIEKVEAIVEQRIPSRREK